MQSIRSRDPRIDTVRALACLLLVTFHAVGGDSTSGLRLSPDHMMRQINETLGIVRMPLFTIVSGIVYALHPVDWSNARAFLRGKALRLLMPLVFVGYLFAATRMLTPGVHAAVDHAALLYLPLTNYAHFWFIQALMLIFVLIIPFEASGLSHRKAGMALLMTVATLVFVVRESLPHPFSLDRAAYLLPFFLAGVSLRRFSHSIHRPGLIAAGLVGAPTLMSLALIAAAGSSGVTNDIAGMALGIGFAIVILALTPPIAALAEIGHYSYTIYLFHVFFTAEVRIMFGKLGVANVPVLIVAAVALGVAGPIMVHRTLETVPYLSRMFLGIKARPRRRRKPVASEQVA